MDFGESSLWLADYGNDRILRVDAATEELFEQVTLPKVGGK
jgi:hypothetical protein